MRTFIGSLLMLLSLVMFGCSDGSSDAPAPDAVHPPGWLQLHGAEAVKSPGFQQCAGCHGVDLRGQGNVPGCFAASYNGQACHASGPGSLHPVGPAWLLPSGTVADSHVLAALNNPDPCISCHTLSGGGIDPACRQCHTAAAPNFSLGTCNSCHNDPPDNQAPDGVRPNREGAHNEHRPATMNTGDCAACHNGFGTDTLGHYDASEPADVLILSTFDAKTGAAGYDPAADTCSSVSCHGGQPSPAWLTGVLDVNTACASCHVLGTAAQTPQFNSYYSGLHSTHVSRSACTVCHAVAALATDHFIGLDTPAFEGDPALTIAAAIGYNAANSSCTTNLAGCHQGQVRGWAASVGAPHPVGATWRLPSGTADSSHVLAALATTPPASGCLGCHTLAGGGIASACNLCHTAHAPNFVLGSCNSCHNAPPDSSLLAGGNVRPNREGSHSEHDLLTGATQNCSACHNGSGTNTLGHYDAIEPANVTILNTYDDADAGTPTYSAGSCSNISCHGGQPTPAWLTGVLDVNTACASCHVLGTAAQTPQFNSYYSGLHSTHVSRSACTVCHAVAALATDHFIGLDTPAFEGDPALTIAAAIGYNAVNSTCTTNLAGCHPGQVRGWAGGAVTHPVGATWLLPSGTVNSSHVLAALADSAPCIGCHTLAGGGVDPACNQCHAASAPNFVPGTCSSCHNAPPDSLAAGGGNVRPNREGAHLEHDPLTAATVDCSACHNGFGTDTLGHYDPTEPANVAFPAIYNAQSGAAGYTAATDSCTNVSCHGGQVTPNWLTGTLDVNTQCASCHQAGATQFNSYSSGEHVFHMGFMTCTQCHNTTTLAVSHFTNLDTPAMEGPASATVGGGTTLISVYTAPSCTPTSATGCHGTFTW